MDKLVEVFTNADIARVLNHRVVRGLLKNLTTGDKFSNTLCFASLLTLLSGKTTLKEVAQKFYSQEERLGEVLPHDLTEAEMTVDLTVPEDKVDVIFGVIGDSIPNLLDYLYSDEQLEKIANDPAELRRQ